MKKKLLIVLATLLTLWVYANTATAEIIWISESEWDSKTSEFWFSQKCDEIRNEELYVNHYGIYLDNFINPSSNSGPLYIWANRVLTRGNYLLYNKSNHPKWNGFAIFNYDLLNKISWKVNPWQTIRHMTTAEEVSEATFSYNWSFATPYIASDGKKFNIPNYRSDGTYPTTPTFFPNWDTEFRTITLYDSDDNLATKTNNRAIVECQNIVIRWCGDGILDKKNGEVCDPKDPNKTGRWSDGCSVDCKAKEKDKVPPVCNSEFDKKPVYNNNFPTSRLTSSMKLCNPGEVLNLKGPDANGKYSWSCGNDGITLSSEACVAYDLRCGDGKKNGSEQCDPKDPNKTGRWSDGCSVDCKAKEKDKVPPLCNSEYNGQTFYNHNYPTPIWNPTLNLCSVGTVGNFDGPNYHDPLKKGFYSWTCNGEAGTTPVNCQAKEQRCGDGKKNGNEQCDPNDSSKTGRGTWGCSASCEPVKEKPNIDVEKTTLDKDKYYAPGEEVGFKIRFKNTTSTVAKDVIVRDYLPQNLEYVSSQIYGVSPVASGSYIKDGIFIVEYSGFNLAPSQEGYLYLTGKVKTEHLSDRINTVYVEVEWGIFWDCDTDDYKVEKPKLTIKKTVDKTHVQIGEEVEFRIRVDIKAGSYTGLTIYDDLPIGLAYVPNSQALVDKSSGLAVNQASFKDSPRLEWKLEFPQRIKKGEFIVLKIRAKVLEADAENAYFNNACIEVPEDPDICEPEDVKISRDLKIKKYVNNKLEDAGKADDKMTFEKDATAYFILEVSDASSPLTGFRVEDTIRGNLNYLDSTDLAENAFTGNIILWENRAVEYTIIPTVTPLVGNETKIVWNVKFTKGSFKPGDKLILKFKAKVLGDQDNIAKVCFTKDNKETEEICRQDPAAVETPKIENLLKIKKYVNDKLEDMGRNDDTMRFSKGTTAYFTIEVAGATNPLTGFRVVDKIPANLAYQNSYDLTNNAFTGVIIFSGSRNPEYKVSVNLSDTSTNPEIVWQIDMLGDTFMSGDVFKAQFKAIVNGATTNISHVYYPKRDGTEWTDQDPAAVTIPGGSSGWGGRSGWGGSTPKCGDGYRNGMEMCDMGSNGGMIKGGKMFKNESYVDERYKDKEVFCTSSCMLEELPACFNTQNGSPSIMKGEMLPFYFNLEGVLGKDVKAKDYQDNLKDHFFIWEEGSTICTSKDLNKIDLRSMMCSFEVYGPGKGNSNLVYSGTIPCMNLNGWNDTNGKIYPRIVSFVEQNKNGRFGGSLLNNKGEVKDVFASLDDGWQNYPTLLPFSSKALIKNFGTSNMKIDGAITQKGSTINLFGEYKLSWTKIDFSYCAENGKDKEGNQIYELTKYQEGYPRVCEVDFAVTDHYLIQKSPYGIGTKASEDLSKYQLKNGTKFLDAYSANLKQGGTEYAVSAEVGQTFANFQKKYDKIAVKVKDNLYKVPGKSIYLYKGNDTVDLKNMLWDNVKTAFTFIADKDILIKWNLETNAMIMTKGKIEIDASASCHGRKGQNSTEGQLLQGIFYAGAGFKSVGHEKLKNTVVNLNASERCNYGNLRIQGVVLGDLSDVVANRRSELYTRFEGTGGGTDGKEKADKVLNGGSVVVEYHPNLWSSLPPGAEEFNKVLSVYR